MNKRRKKIIVYMYAIIIPYHRHFRSILSKQYPFSNERRRPTTTTTMKYQEPNRKPVNTDNDYKTIFGKSVYVYLSIDSIRFIGAIF